MDPIPTEFELSVRRSRDRRRILLALASLGEAYIGHLSRHTGIRWSRVKAILVGGPPAYAVDRSLVALGMAREERRAHTRVYVITNRGLRKARSIVAARVRRRRPSAKSLAAEGDP